MSDTVSINEVFISYSHKDKEWFDRLQIHLRPFKRIGISIWDDTKIKPGQKWKIEIKAALQRARVAVLMVSPNFLASDFIVENELPPLLEAAEKEGVTIIWLPISDSAYELTAIASYQAASDPSLPLNMQSQGEIDKILVKVCKTIKDALNP